ncbi:MAG TPA: hypothetical protein VFP87_06890, partial [Chitinophagaceae bacterium]|nr:hypothetical protein [Chitinophagaceae bacterium]
FCMATGGMDAGDFCFELSEIWDHINTHLSLLRNELSNEKLVLRFFLKDANQKFHEKLNQTLKNLEPGVNVEIEQSGDAGDYYKLARFKFFLVHKGKEINLSDGGLVDWTQKLIPNKKHRLIISGVGTELIHKITYKQL